jgi:hypothetical protein
MIKFINLMVLILSFFTTMAQELKIDISYKYIYANHWDKIVQTYNFSRPFNSNNQPLLMNGFNSSVSRIFKPNNNISHGLNVSYSYFRSSAEDQNFTNNLNLHFLNIGYILHYQNKEKNNHFYSDLIIAVTTSRLSRHLNGRPFEYDNNKSKALSIGGEADIKFGYNLQKINNKYLSTFIDIGYSPYLYSPNTETVINQTKGLVGKKWTTLLNSQLGLAYHFRQ